MTSLNSFLNIEDKMLWKGAALKQIEEFQALEARLGIRLLAVGSHRSKSIELPVVKCGTPVGTFTMRDNFYDTNLLVELDEPCPLTLDEFFSGIVEPKDWAWYLGEIEKCRGYSWREWTDEEMADERITRVKDKRPGVDLWWDKTPGQKAMWAKRLTDPEWYGKDWSSSKLTWDGEFGPGARIFLQYTPFAEGISTRGAQPIYVQGARDFIIAVGSIEQAGTLIERIINAQKG